MEKTKEIYMDNKKEKASEALKVTDEFIKNQGLTGKDAIHLRLLAEEAIGMVRTMADDYRALFWMEKEADKYNVKLLAKTPMNLEKKEELLSVSSSGENSLAKGFMGKLGDMIENGLLNFDELMKIRQQEVSEDSDYGFVSMGVPGEFSTMDDPLVWSLSSYKESVYDNEYLDDGLDDACNELEKSIVASIAKDVVVGVKKDRVDMTISWSC